MRCARVPLCQVVFALAALAACRSSDVAGPRGSAVGTYTLRTINGTRLPWVLDSATSSKTELLADRITINADGTFSESASFRMTQDTLVTTQDSWWAGVYSLADVDLQLLYTYNAYGLLAGSMREGKITFKDAEHEYVFSR